MVEPPPMLDVGLCSAAISDTAVQKGIVKVTFVAEGDDVCTVVAKETMSAVREIDESARHDVPLPYLSRPAVGEGQLIGVSIRSMVAEGTEERFLALHTEVMTSALVKLAADDESASDVVVHGMV